MTVIGEDSERLFWWLHGSYTQSTIYYHRTTDKRHNGKHTSILYPIHYTLTFAFTVEQYSCTTTTTYTQLRTRHNSSLVVVYSIGQSCSKGFQSTVVYTTVV